MNNKFWIDNLEEDNEECLHEMIYEGKCEECGKASVDLYEEKAKSEGETDEEDYIY